MRAFIQLGNDDQILNPSCYSAFYGFSQLGWQIEYFKGIVPVGLARQDLVVGWISSIKQALRNINIVPPAEIDYPEELESFYGRKIWKSTLKQVSQPQAWPVFVKPVNSKQFDGHVLRKFDDLLLIGRTESEDVPVWCSQVIEIVTEWRCFVKYGKVIGCPIYLGDQTQALDISFVERAIESYKQLPAGCSIDVGLTKEGKYIIVEVNDGYALGTYGLQPLLHAKLLSARWCQMVDIPDPCQWR